MKPSFYLTNINIMNLDVGHCFQKGRLLNAILAGSCCKAHIEGNWTMLILLESISPTITFLTYVGGLQKRPNGADWEKEKSQKGASCLF